MIPFFLFSALLLLLCLCINACFYLSLPLTLSTNLYAHCCWSLSIHILMPVRCECVLIWCVWIYHFIVALHKSGIDFGVVVFWWYVNDSAFKCVDKGKWKKWWWIWSDDTCDCINANERANVIDKKRRYNSLFCDCRYTYTSLLNWNLVHICLFMLIEHRFAIKNPENNNKTLSIYSIAY